MWHALRGRQECCGMSRLHSRASVRHKARERWIRVDLRPTRLTTRIESLDWRMSSALLEHQRAGRAIVVRSLSQRSAAPGRTTASHCRRAHPLATGLRRRCCSSRVLKNYAEPSLRSEGALRKAARAGHRRSLNDLSLPFKTYHYRSWSHGTF